MDRIDPTTLTGPRAYFTAFDHRIVERADDVEALRLNCERRLKLLLLLKAQIVCAASHLQSPIAQAMFRRNPFLLSDGHVLPALRSVKGSITEAFKASSDVARFYEDHVPAVVTWDLQENSAWFRSRFVSELSDPGSVIRLQTKGITADMVDRFVQSLHKTDLLDRESVRKWAEPLPESDRAVVLAFRDLVYHMSGARVVNCEGSLPQEEYIDFDLADLTQRRTRLSEDTVFWKLFVEQALDALQIRGLPLGVLDLLDFEDVVALREPLQESTFREQYDEMVRTAVRLVRRDSLRLVEDVERLERLRTKLEQTFSAVFDNEVERFLRAKRVSASKQVVSSAASVAVGVAGFFPIVGPVLSGTTVAKDSIALYMNVGRLGSGLPAMARLVLARERAMRKIAKRGLPDATPNLGMVEMLTKTITERLKMS